MNAEMNPLIRPTRAALLGAAWLVCFPLLAEDTALLDTPAGIASSVQASIDRGEEPSWWSPQLPAEVQTDVENKGSRLAEVLEIEDAEKRARVEQLISVHFARVWAWHQEVDEELDAAWEAWDEARSNADGKEKDELRALAVMSERIDPIYAGFAPQIRGFLESLRDEVGQEGADRVVDRYTRSPGAKRTFDAYVAMIPEMKDEEKAVLWARLVRAREESLAAWSDGRIIKIFKKHKVRNEFSIDYFGYDYRKRYQQWASQR